MLLLLCPSPSNPPEFVRMSERSRLSVCVRLYFSCGIIFLWLAKPDGVVARLSPTVKAVCSVGGDAATLLADITNIIIYNRTRFEQTY